jgi:hypothetical protein
MNEQTKNWIDSASYEQLLSKWRHAALGDIMFQGETGKYYSTVMFRKRDKCWMGQIMNERIRQLAEEAELNATLLFNKEKLEKFAQLIVQECVTWVNDNVGMVDEEARVDLLKHFGVEE